MLYAHMACKDNMFDEDTDDVQQSSKKVRTLPQMGPVDIFVLDKNKKHDAIKEDSIRNDISITINTIDGFKKTMLPFCGVDFLLSPDAIVRGSLFGLGTHEIIQKKVDGKWSRIRKRLHYPQGAPKDCGEFGTVRISYIGEALDQGDLDVWLRLLDLAKNDFTQTIDVSLMSLLTSLGRSTGGAAYHLLNSSLERLSTGHIKLQNGDVKVIDGIALIKSFKLHETTGHARIELNCDVARLFSTERNLGWTRLQKSHRESLVGKDLALWLHAFYSSHAKPIPFKLHSLHSLCGSNSQLKEFKRLLVGTEASASARQNKGALDELEKVGFLMKWRIEDGVLFVTRNSLTMATSQIKFAKK